ncbi:AAA family ATPase [Aeromonas salmonicida]|uniref:AAA family ATPase n=1 Tax=Aeromonas salmonicida TaxID=645 RepID=UPI003D0297F4
MQQQPQLQSIILHKFKRYGDKTVLIPSGYTLLAGGNNSGKSTFMQAFALWEFCKSVIVIEKGREALNQNLLGGQGVGVSAEDFLPMNLPSLKHLWTNLKPGQTTEVDGYTLWVKLNWAVRGDEKFLCIALSLSNDRLFIKIKDSNLTDEDIPPQIAYIPPFAGILKKEPYHTLALRNKLIGQGLSGSAIRNTLLELNRENRRRRAEARGERDRISRGDLRLIRESDPWEHLTELMRRVFKTELYVDDFDDRYHTYISVHYRKGDIGDNGSFSPFPAFNKRDIMVEGSGFLQMLNVISLALDPAYHVIFLDEPDAHLHPSLQFVLKEELNCIAEKYNKHILVATHSTELIESQVINKILKFDDGDITLINEEAQRVSLIAGLGGNYNDKITNLMRHKKVLFVENESDHNMIRKWAEILGVELANNYVVWPTSVGHKERMHLFSQLRSCINGLKGISLRDRDTAEFNTVAADSLYDRGYPSNFEIKGIKNRTWRFKYIEGYTLSLDAIRQAAINKHIDPDVVVTHIQNNFHLILTNFNGDGIPLALRDLSAKEIVSEGRLSLHNSFNISKYDIASAFSAQHIHGDIRKIIDCINNTFL